VHFIEYQNRLVNAFFDVKQLRRQAVGRKAKVAVDRKFGLVKAALRGMAALEDVDPAFRSFVLEWRARLPAGPYKKGSMAYDVHDRPDAYFAAMVAIAGELERLGKRSFHVLPLRVGNVPCHIVLDTTAFCQGTGTQIPPTMTPAAKISVWSRMIRPTMRPFLRGPKDAPICVFDGGCAPTG